MRPNSLHPYFMPSYQARYNNEEAAALRQDLRDKLIEHRAQILMQLNDSPKVIVLWDGVADTDRYAALSRHFDNLVETLNNHDEHAQRRPLWTSIYQQLQFELSHERIIVLASEMLQIMQPLLGERGFAAGVDYVQHSAAVAERIKQRYYLSATCRDLVRQVFAELAKARLAPEETLDSEAMLALEKDFVAFLQAWADHPAHSGVVLELDFIGLFAERLLVCHSAPNRFWELLILKLDRLLATQNPKRYAHPLAQALEVLLAGVPRFGFISSFIQYGLPQYRGLQAPVGEWLVCAMLLATRPHSALYEHMLRELDGRAWLAKLDGGPERLLLCQRQALDALRPLWERAYLDWLDEAGTELYRLLDYTRQSAVLLAQTREQRRKLSSVLTEGVTDVQGLKTAERLLQDVLAEACAAAAAAPFKQARALFRYRLSLLLDPVRERAILRRGREISLALQRLQVETTALQPLLDTIRPILAALDEVIRANLDYHLRWFGEPAALAETLKSRSPWLVTDIQATLRLLAVFLRLYDPQRAVLELKVWYIQHLLAYPDERVVSTELTAGYRQVAAYLQQMKPAPDAALLRALEAFIDLLPAATLVRHLGGQSQAIAVATAAQVASSLPDYAERVGKEGMRLCVRDNQTTLLRIAYVYSGIEAKPDESLLWWWSTSVGAYLVNRSSTVFKNNFNALRTASHRCLQSGEADLVTEAVGTIYSQALGVRLQTEAAESRMTFTPLTLEGPIWQQLFGVQRPLARHSRTLGRQLATLDITADCREALTTFLEALSEHGDEEAAWQRVQRHFLTTLQQQSTQTLETAWRQMLDALPVVLNEVHSTYWTVLLIQGLPIVRQVGLGMKLARSSEEISALIAARLTSAEAAQERGKCARDLRLLLDHCAVTLQTQPPTLAALNIGRYLVETIAPHVSYPASVWHSVWQVLGELLAPALTSAKKSSAKDAITWEDYNGALLDEAERRALRGWLAQLDAMADGLALVGPVGRDIFCAQAPIFADRPSVEQQWRACIGGLLTAAITGERAPVPGPALAQRLLLTSPVFAEETADSWQSRQYALAEAFEQVLGESLTVALAACHTQIIAHLMHLPQLRELSTLRGAELFCAMLDGLPGVRDHWYADLLARHSDERWQTALPTDQLIVQITGWRLPEPTLLAQTTELCTHAYAFQRDTALLEKKRSLFNRQGVTVAGAELAALKLLLRMMALRSIRQTPTAQAAGLVQGVLPAGDPEQQRLDLTLLAETLSRRHGPQHPLAQGCQALVDAVQAPATAGDKPAEGFGPYLYA